MAKDKEQQSQGTQLALFEDQLAGLAAQAVKAEQSTAGVSFLSTQGGILKWQGNPIAGNKLQCVILASPVERLYYAERYDPTKKVGPACTAISINAIGMTPVQTGEGLPVQHATCEGCPKNEWGSAANGGKGKACRETRRLILLPSDALTSPEVIAAAEIAALRPPVTSLKNYAGYVQTIAATYKRPPLAMVTEIAVVPDAKTQFKVTFSMVKAIDDATLITALMARATRETEAAIATAGVVDGDDVGATQSTRF